MAFAQDRKVQTVELKVKGVCGMCEDRIENAALIKGVKLADWDKETEILKVVYKPAKIDIVEVHKSVAKAGHETDKVKADKEAYEKLPACCKYMDGAEKH
jgi:hypothetical protein